MERRQRILIAAITIALAAQVNISIITDGFILTLSLFILPVFLYFNDDVNPIHICLGIAIASPIFRGLLLFLVGDAELMRIIEFVFTDMIFYVCYGTTFYYIYWHRSSRHKGTFFFAIIICDYLSNVIEMSLLLKFTHYHLEFFGLLFFNGSCSSTN